MKLVSVLLISLWAGHESLTRQNAICEEHRRSCEVQWTKKYCIQATGSTLPSKYKEDSFPCRHFQQKNLFSSQNKPETNLKSVKTDVIRSLFSVRVQTGSHFIVLQRLLLVRLKSGASVTYCVMNGAWGRGVNGMLCFTYVDTST